MNRKKFIRSCGLACAGLIGTLPVMHSCTSSRLIPGTISGDELIIPLTAFETRNGNTVYQKKYIVVENERLKYPICIYRISEVEYSALWMRCTHQGTELQVFGERLQCPAHGSEFSRNGEVHEGPASEPLRTFQYRISGNNIHLSLKAI
ncbi:MAG: Rieske (2Fe-2S) protein [Chitinophagaceae bacterium]|nr:MAG: Rieske (2Fe-2S) protein [Chitinophagaceae bacterium]